jgi:hypothetical protein
MEYYESHDFNVSNMDSHYSPKRVRPRRLNCQRTQEFMEARIKVLSNLYAELMPSFKTARYESLEGVGARKKTKNIDVQESISPFDLECFEDIMPSLEEFGLLPEEDPKMTLQDSLQMLSEAQTKYKDSND